MLFFSPPFFLLLSPAIPLYHSYCKVICLNPVGPLWAYRLFFSQRPNTAISSFITSLASSCVPFVFPCASQARLLSFGSLGPFLNFAFSWAFTKFFRLPWPNYIIPHPWGSWVYHEPLTFFTFVTLGMSWPILTFPHHILPMVCFSLFPDSFKPIYLLNALFLSHGLVVHYSCRLGLIGFLSICQLFSVCVVGLLLPTWASKMAINI